MFDLDSRLKKISELEKKSTADDFWDDQERAQAILKQLKIEKDWIDSVKSIESDYEDLTVLKELVEESDDSTEAVQEFVKAAKDFEEKLSELELRTFLSEPDDMRDAIVSIHPGAGGTESTDWASMLHRMYMRYADKKGFETELIDYQPGDEAGIKSSTFEVKGDYAYGYLKSESGVHRLVRISPFDANKRRHTSFASVFVYPLIESNIDVDIKDDDIRIDTFRASGAGGQHVNKVSSAVRITHLETGIVVSCQSQRSQLKNKESAMKVLRARLYQLYKEKEDAKREKAESEKKKIEWGSQIRSYVFHPYNLVKDHRTEHETSNAEAVMEGELDEFINAYLTTK
ncbi:MAG: peptide chain release factor 2 [candidate division Zixibacteria bacterium]|nr:peptide chain release factor 2 [candidate division Zixibacteria bacterium]NIR66428.1 peptide chain release factor 2 [candidate division Zixibacteria bacterium]NIS18072.1 peptide chain release factor 2 [candidate division Zixibacteria bacterium]NIS48018.1 peptide chain release factor 2 [candidate division Zixibacteria bacterium]NIT54352.1 peptide chain release factor 2 [candidate division Zixibacteria bacterium]